MSPPGARRRAEAQRLLDLLNALGRATFRQLLWQRASELDLTYAQSHVLFHLLGRAGRPALPASLPPPERSAST